MSDAQEKQILEYLMAGNKLTALEALDKFKCFRLASRISNLRLKHGKNIVKEMIKTPNTDKAIAQYYMPDHIRITQRTFCDPGEGRY